MRTRNVVAAVLGAGAALAIGATGEKVAPGRRTELAGVGLLTAAAIYPAARRRSFGDLKEKAVLVAACGVVVGAGVRGGRRGRALVAGGWFAHAGFDAAFTPHRASRIPSWYPAMCAGYDVALAARLATAR